MTLSNLHAIPRYRAGQSLSAAAVANLLDELRRAATIADSAATLYRPAVADAANRPDLPPDLARHPRWPEWSRALMDAGFTTLRFPTGIAAFRIGDSGIAIVPTFPLRLDHFAAGHLTAEIPSAGMTTNAILDDGINDAPLRALLDAEYLVGAALVRLGRYAIAVYQGRLLLVSKTDTRYVKSRHRAGGTSQQRFRRVREHQIHRLYIEASRILTRQWQPYADRLDYVALGGEAATVNGFIKECPLLTKLAPITLPGRLEVREPNRAALDTAGELLYRCRVYPLQWT